jgi:hypothetical protein
MPTDSYDGRCIVDIYGNGYPVRSKSEFVLCTTQGGSYMPNQPDGGRDRLTRLAADSFVQPADEVTGPFSNAAVSAKLVSLSLCMMRRRSPDSELVKCLDKLDSAYFETLTPVFEEAPELKARFAQLVLDASWFAARALSDDHPADGDRPLTADDLLDEGEALVAELVSRTSDISVINALKEVIELASELRGVGSADLIEGLKKIRPTGEPVVVEGGIGTEHINGLLQDAHLYSGGPKVYSTPVGIDVAVKVGSLFQELRRQEEAQKQINIKAAQIGAGAPVGSLHPAGNGYVIRYSDLEIYFSAATGAHELHGDILAKYKAKNAVWQIGLPTTDETGTPDGVGRYNHFEKGSIYWTPHTGPMIVSGAIQGFWAAQGWETGQLGYPVADIFILPGLYPTDNPQVAWSVFENGAVVSTADGVGKALAANLTPDDLRRMIRSFVDQGVHQAGQGIGLQPQTEILEVSPWSYGFWAAYPRLVTFRLHGFHDNGVLPDTDFELDLRLRFSLVWTQSFTAPTSKTLVAALDWHRVSAHGIASGQVSQGVFDGITSSFWRGGPDPDHPEVPDGAVFIATVPTGINQTGKGNVDVIDVLTTAQGGLQVLVNPLPMSPLNIGEFRRQQAQNAIDNLVAG